MEGRTLICLRCGDERREELAHQMVSDVRGALGRKRHLLGDLDVDHEVGGVCEAGQVGKRQRRTARRRGGCGYSCNKRSGKDRGAEMKESLGHYKELARRMTARWKPLANSAVPPAME